MTATEIRAQSERAYAELYETAQRLQTRYPASHVGEAAAEVLFSAYARAAEEAAAAAESDQ